MGEPADVLDRARREVGLSHIELWLRYFELGGMAAPLELEAYLFGALQAGAHEHDVVVHALNERFAELGRGYPVAYANPLIAQSDRLGQVRVALDDVGNAGPGAWDDLCRVCARALSVTGAGIIVAVRGGHRVSLGASDELERAIEQAQFALGEGPCMDAGRFGVAVHEPDLATWGPGRWPMFAARAIEAGVTAIFALPLLVEAECVGAINLYRDRPGALSARQLSDAVAVANLVAPAVLAVQGAAPAGSLGPQSAELPVPAAVHQAAGMIAVQLDITVAAALVRLRGYASAENRPIDEIADLVVARTLVFDDRTGA